MKHLRVLVAQVIFRVFTPLCPGGCRQPVERCTCSWLPPLPDEIFDPPQE